MRSFFPQEFQRFPLCEKHHPHTAALDCIESQNYIEQMLSMFKYPFRAIF